MIKLKKKTIIALLILIGSCCFLQFLVVGVVNIIRGYTIATYLPHFILLLGCMIFILLRFLYQGKQTINSLFSIIASIMLIYVSSISISQGGHLEDAEEYYDNFQYQETVKACKKEAHTWYNLLRYNYRERNAMNLMAEAYCQLEDFDNARNTYKLMIDRYSGEYYGDRAQDSLLKLEEGLKTVAYYPDHITESPLPDYIKEETSIHLDPKRIEAIVLSDIALKYRYDLNCNAKALEVYGKILNMDVSEKKKKFARNQIMELKVTPDSRDAVLLGK